MKKKIISTTALLFISVNAFASMDECTEANSNNSYKKVIEYCQPLANSNKQALGFTANAYTQLDDGMKSQEYLQKYVDKYKSDENSGNDSKKVLASYYVGLGNGYYFATYGERKDIKKGLGYITKGAELGNNTAQKQLGDMYNSSTNTLDLNVATSYMWYTLSIANGNPISVNNLVKTLNNQAPYCLAQGKILVANAYLNGEDGLSKDTSQAKKYLTQAIALYKKGKPSDDDFKYCPKQKGLDLASAEKLLENIN